MFESIVDGDGLHMAIAFRMSERLIDIEKLDVFALVIIVDRLQTGDVTNERWSCQAAENQHRMLAF